MEEKDKEREVKDARVDPCLYIPSFPNSNFFKNGWLNSILQFLICAVRRHGGLHAWPPEVDSTSDLAVVLQRISEWADVKHMTSNGTTIRHYGKFKKSFFKAIGCDQSWK